MRRNNVFIILFLFSFLRNFSQEPTHPGLPIIPKPSHCKVNTGSFTLNSETKLVMLSNDSILKKDVDFFNDYLFAQYGFRLQYSKTFQSQNAIIIQKPGILDGDINLDSYALNINPQNITIQFMYNGGAYQGAGCFYAFQTLIQLLPIKQSKDLKIPCTEINDISRFKWRGMHLDVCRHFFSINFIKKYIDILAMYKMNTFHWHLTDDQGWRIEIKKYPKLIEVGAWRKGTMVGKYSDHKYDSIPYGGFYTQEQIKEIVAYATKRHVTIVPEIEMPGHAVAAIASYPWLSCTGKQIDVEKGWGVFEDVFCTKDSVFNFLQNVLDEVIPLFPGNYIHIGGDESPKTRWKVCSDCQALIKKEQLKDEHELQSYFIKRIEKYVNSKGKQIIGWDEILEGGLAPNAAVMSWQGIEGGIAAVKQKHLAVMTPGSHCYFDHYQAPAADEPLSIGGYTPIEKVYSYEPIPEGLTSEEQSYILGAQANLWTEYILNEKHLEYMALPRMAALAEVVWTPKEQKNETDFLTRLQQHFLLLDKLKINYAKALYKVEQHVFSDSINNEIKLELKANPALGIIRFNKNEYEPKISSEEYHYPITLSKTSIISAALFAYPDIYEEKGKMKGKVSTARYAISKSTNKPITLKTMPSKSYSGDGAFTLVNSIVGTLPRINEQWLGWNGKDLEATINLEKEEYISNIRCGFLKEELSWIYLPKEVEFLISTDGKKYTIISKSTASEFLLEHFATATFKQTKAQYIKIIAKNYGEIHSGKPGAGSKSWLFCDEILID
jgi:hexosaminidase